MQLEDWLLLKPVILIFPRITGGGTISLFHKTEDFCLVWMQLLSHFVTILLCKYLKLPTLLHDYFDLYFSCKIWGFHSSDYEEWCLLGCYAVWLLYEPTFRRNVAPPSSGMTRIGKLGTTLAVTSNRRTLRRNTWLVLTRATQRNIPEDTILCNPISFTTIHLST
jgi:hypothetical protein